MKIIEVEGSFNCPFQYEDQEHLIPSTDMCAVDNKECRCFLGTGCWLKEGAIQVLPVPHPMDGDTLCTTCGQDGAANCECCGTCGAGPDELCDCGDKK